MKYLKLIAVSLIFVGCVSVKVNSKRGDTVKSDNDTNIVKQSPKQTHDTSMYPKAKDGYQQRIITLDKKTNEDNYKLEIYVGKTMLTDCNTYGLTGQFIEAVAEGWGYPYWEFNSNGQVRSTMMSCQDDTKKETFVRGEKKLLRYNSKLPVVVYVPKGFEVRYAIWEKSKNTYTTN